MPTRADVRRATGLVVLLGAWNDLVVPRLPERAYAPVNAAATAALLTAARTSGIPWDELGLRPGRLPAGARWGGACAALVAAGYAAGLAVPACRPLLADARVAGLSGRELVARVLVRIPVGTVLWEEVAFRGVLPPVLRRVLPRREAAAVASALFGVWHVAPTLQGLAVNGLAVDPVRRAAAVTTACLGTAGAALLFASLRQRSGSLLAPALLHLAANDLGVLAAAVASRGGAGRVACTVSVRADGGSRR
ncbi:CAAX prenyl protease-like protein [Geodermatophilus tzadiensis]|uniref:CAAX prenyl protease-like protein n=1 Tax=Geodermatophilus tzadiensis TaxID=1137988 RepID=A0A2T0TP28_9ACTN|nr:CPBP family intramembrane glutamic endopeptidase [Geodermatophilus tzadiensis]PRY47484.1 CAAX prenyl protease-like protein [Geodermatophilus tzadiensis]